MGRKNSAGFMFGLVKHDKAVTGSYDFAETETELYVTEQVNNTLFVRDKR